MEDKRVSMLCHDHQDLVNARSVFEQDWRDIRDLIRPVTGEVNPYGPGYIPARRSEKVLDGTAVDALEELGSALHSYLTSPVERWFTLELAQEPLLMRDPEVLMWLEDTADRIFAAYADPRSMFNTALHEVYLDLGSYGTAYLNQEWGPDKHLVFKAAPIADCWIRENSNGLVDTIHHQIRWTKRQLAQEFGELPPKIMEEKNEERLFTIVHCVFPRTDRNAMMLNSRNMPFASCWISIDTKEMIYESGYRSFPYHCPRWMKNAGEVYGRSPAMKCLPDVKLLQAMELTIIKAAEKIVDPPLQVPDDAFLVPIRTAPGALLFKEPNAENIEPLLTQGNIPVGLELTNQKREFIKKAFYNDWIRMEKENQEMTAYEVQDRRDEKLRLLAPMLGRQETELLGPMVSRSFELLVRNRQILPPPPELTGKTLKVSYASPASAAQTGSKAVAMGRFVQELVPLAQVDPTILDIVDMDAFARELARARGITRVVLRSDDDLAQLRQGRQAQQQAQQLAQIAEPVSKSIKNLADASSKGGALVGGI